MEIGKMQAQTLCCHLTAISTVVYQREKRRKLSLPASHQLKQKSNFFLLSSSVLHFSQINIPNK